MRYLVTGRTGQVGSALVRELEGAGEVWAPGRAELDLVDADALRAAVRSYQPDWIVNAAAHTAVDRAEEEADLALEVNAHAPRVLSAEAARAGAGILHFSTDYVFDGCKGEPYVETDSAHPLSVYGRTKRLGEVGVRAAGCPHLILRVSWVYSARGRNFFTVMCDLFRSEDVVRVVGDQHGSPTRAIEIARAASSLLYAVGRPSSLGERSGTYHMPSVGWTSWFGFANEIARRMAALGEPLTVKRIERITTDEYPTPARRPGDSRMSGDLLATRFGVRLPAWEDQVADCVAEIFGRHAAPV